MKKICSILLLATLTSCFGKNPEKTGLEGKPMPSFTLLLSDSVTHFNTAQIPVGERTVLLFFGPYCPYSRAQMEEIITHIKDLEQIHFYVFTNFPFSDMKKFYSYYELEKYKNITVGIDYENYFGGYYQVKGFPYTAIYGKDKLLKKAFIGEVFNKQIKSISEN